MSSATDEKIEYLMKKFLKEAFSKNFESFSQKRKQEKEEPKSKGFEDMFNMFKDFVDTITYGEQKEQTVDTKAEDLTQDVVGEDVNFEKEIGLLRDQIEQLKEQLQDKDDIINLLKEQLKEAKAKSTTSRSRKTTTTSRKRKKADDGDE